MEVCHVCLGFYSTLYPDGFCSKKCRNKNEENVQRENKNSQCIKVWYWNDAPEHLKSLSQHGGDEDWVALVPPNYPHYIPWLYSDSFGACGDVSEHKTDEGTVYIGAHS